MKAKTIIIISLIIVAFAIGFFLDKIALTGKTILSPQDPKLMETTFTKALCNKNNEYADFLVTCQGNHTVKIEMITEMKQMPQDWEDPRIDTNSLC